MTFEPIINLGVLVLFLLAALGLILSSGLTGSVRKLTALRRILAALALFVAALGPTVYGPAEKTTMRSSNDIFIVLDTTGSVSAEDYSGDETRLEGMRGDIAQIVEHFAGARFTLITFDIVPLVRVPLTRDTGALMSAMEVVEPEMTIYSHGTSISEANALLAESLEAAEDAHPERRRIVFYLGDGEQTASEDPGSFALAGELTSGGMVLGYGTEEGGRMLANAGLYGTKDDKPEYIQDRSKTPARDAVSIIDEENLRAIAEQLGVTYEHRTEPGPIPGLDAIEDLADEAHVVQQARAAIPVYWIFALAAFALLLWEAVVITVAIARSAAVGRRS